MSIQIYGRDGQPITMEEFDRLLGDMAYKRVASDDIGPYWVSTVWIGLDHNWSGDGPPIIFETMVFAKGQRDDPEDHSLREFDMQRYASESQALAGHEAMCTLIRATIQEEIEEISPRNSEK